MNAFVSEARHFQVVFSPEKIPEAIMKKLQRFLLCFIALCLEDSTFPYYEKK